MERANSSEGFKKARLRRLGRVISEHPAYFQSVIRERTKARKADGRIIAMWSEMDRLGGQGRTAAAKTL